MGSPALVNKIVVQLRRDILRGVLRPGASVKERDKAAEMGVSRTPMREAIRMLSEEGLIQLRHARSPIVSIPNLKSVTDQTEVLIMLEKLSAKLACENATPDQIATLSEIVAFMDTNFNVIDAIDMFEKDMEFHSAIAIASGNESLADTHKLYLQRLWYPRYLAASKRRNRERVVTEHTRIVDALIARDSGAAQTAVEAHLLNLASDMTEQVALILDSDTKSPNELHKKDKP